MIERTLKVFESFQKVFRKFPASFQKVSGKFSESFQKVSGKFPESFQKFFRNFCREMSKIIVISRMTTMGVFSPF
jgi:hypothetical protein